MRLSDGRLPALMETKQNAAVMGLQVGDMIRVGQATHGSYSDYVTILELIDIDELSNTFSVGLDLGNLPVVIASGAKVLKDQTPLKQFPANRRKNIMLQWNRISTNYNAITMNSCTRTRSFMRSH